MDAGVGSSAGSDKAAVCRCHCVRSVWRHHPLKFPGRRTVSIMKQ